MRKFTILLMAICFVTSCSEFDDSEIWDKLNDHEYRIAYLEEVCNKMNADIANLQTIVTAIENNDFIVNAFPLSDGSGYSLTFKSGKSIVVYNGKNGVNGKDGITPIVSVMKDVDGIYYWTVNGEWLLVNGEKVRASALDGEKGADGKDGQNGIDGIGVYVGYDNYLWNGKNKINGGKKMKEPVRLLNDYIGYKELSAKEVTLGEYKDIKVEKSKLLIEEIYVDL